MAVIDILKIASSGISWLNLLRSAWFSIKATQLSNKTVKAKSPINNNQIEA